MEEKNTFKDLSEKEIRDYFKSKEHRKISHLLGKVIGRTEEDFNNKWVPKTFYPYTSSVTYTLFTQNHNYETLEHQELDAIWSWVLNVIEQKGLQLDNKIVLEFTPKTDVWGEDKETFFRGGSIFIGRYDNIVSIGLGVWQPDHWTREHNREIN